MCAFFFIITLGLYVSIRVFNKDCLGKGEQGEQEKELLYTTTWRLFRHHR